MRAISAASVGSTNPPSSFQRPGARRHDRLNGTGRTMVYIGIQFPSQPALLPTTRMSPVSSPASTRALVREEISQRLLPGEAARTSCLRGRLRATAPMALLLIPILEAPSQECRSIHGSSVEASLRMTTHSTGGGPETTNRDTP